MSGLENLFVCSVFANNVASRVSTHGRLEFTGQNMGVDAYTEKSFVHLTGPIGSSKMGVGGLLRTPQTCECVVTQRLLACGIVDFTTSKN